jgi:hypothetical protein
MKNRTLTWAPEDDPIVAGIYLDEEYPTLKSIMSLPGALLDRLEKMVEEATPDELAAVADRLEDYGIDVPGRLIRDPEGLASFLLYIPEIESAIREAASGEKFPIRGTRNPELEEELSLVGLIDWVNAMTAYL